MGGGTSHEALHTTLQQDGCIVVDVRTPQEFASGHAPGSMNIPLDALPNHLDRLRSAQHIVVCCRSGNRSGQAEQWLKSKGVTQVTNGGTWQQVRDAI